MTTGGIVDVDRLLEVHLSMTQRVAAAFARRHGLHWMRRDLEAVALEAAWEAVRKRGGDLDGAELAGFIRRVAWRRCLDALRYEFGRHGTAKNAARHVDLAAYEPRDATTVEDEIVGAELEPAVVALIEAQFGHGDAQVLLAQLRGVPLEDIAAARGITPSRISQIRRTALDRLRHNRQVRELLLA